MSLEKLESLIRASKYPWWEWDVQKNRLEFNDLKATMLGYNASDFRGKGYQAFTVLVHPEDLEGTMEAMKKVLYGHEDLYQVDYRIRDVGGDYHWYMDRGFVIGRGPSGVPNRLRGIVIDLGKEAEIAGASDFAHRIITNSLLSQGKDVTSFLTVCASCKKVKLQSKTYVEISPELFGFLAEKVSHGLCPDCLARLYPELKQRSPGSGSATVPSSTG